MLTQIFLLVSSWPWIVLLFLSHFLVVLQEIGFDSARSLRRNSSTTSIQILVECSQSTLSWSCHLSPASSAYFKAPTSLFLPLTILLSSEKGNMNFTQFKCFDVSSQKSKTLKSNCKRGRMGLVCRWREQRYFRNWLKCFWCSFREVAKR